MTNFEDFSCIGSGLASGCTLHQKAVAEAAESSDPFNSLISTEIRCAVRQEMGQVPEECASALAKLAVQGEPTHA